MEKLNHVSLVPKLLQLICNEFSHFRSFPLYSIFQTAPEVIFPKSMSDHVNPLLKKLHCLPIASNLCFHTYSPPESSSTLASIPHYSSLCTVEPTRVGYHIVLYIQHSIFYFYNFKSASDNVQNKLPPNL